MFAEDVVYAPEVVSAGGLGVIKLAFKEVVVAAYVQRIGLSSTGYYRTPEIHYDRARHHGAAQLVPTRPDLRVLDGRHDLGAVRRSVRYRHGHHAQHDREHVEQRGLPVLDRAYSGEVRSAHRADGGRGHSGRERQT